MEPDAPPSKPRQTAPCQSTPVGPIQPAPPADAPSNPSQPSTIRGPHPWAPNPSPQADAPSHPTQPSTPADTPAVPARYIMLGGFLGAGKTTSVLRLAQALHTRGLRVGLITNDQGRNLVDTALLASHGFAVEEIAGGCFCCRFPSLKAASENLAASARPDVFIAEAVGSCTDLVATVSYPLRRMYGDRFVIAPLTVVVDPRRALRVLAVEPGKTFSDKVLYIYRKQLEEADVILLNKIDDLTPERRAALRAALESTYPQARVLDVSARTGDGMDAWFDLITSTEMPGGHAMPIDYATYGEGEALLGWLNATLTWNAPDWTDGNTWLAAFAQTLRTALAARDLEVAHLKMTLQPTADPEAAPGLAILNLVGTDVQPEASQHLPDDIRDAQLILNIRAEAPPESLEALVREAVQEANGPGGTNESSHGWSTAEPLETIPPISKVPEGRSQKGSPVTLTIEHLEAFQPGQPVPVHRDEWSDVPEVTP